MRFVKNFVIAMVSIFALLLGESGVCAEEAAFIDGFNDLPLMSGLEELPDLRIVFDKPEGRIIELFVRGTVSEAKVIAFYRETLPQLGWVLSRENVYIREKEQLTLLFESAGIILTVQLSISPH